VPGTTTEAELGPWDERDHRQLARSEGAARSAREVTAVQRLAELVGVVYRLRDDDGCPWDRKQTLASMTSNLIEEAGETADAVARDDAGHVAEELGDTLMNVFLMSRIAADAERFDLADVAAGIAEKLVRRHPHVFGDQSAEDADAALASWEASKDKERLGRSTSALDDVPGHLPALLAAHRLGKLAAATGFDWPDAQGAFDKLNEELLELEQARQGDDRDALEAELGDVLFSVVNVARKLRIDPEHALRRTMVKFRRRFAAIEAALGDEMPSASLETMEALWREAAAGESAPPAEGSAPG
jgi:MazG family protein